MILRATLRLCIIASFFGAFPVSATAKEGGHTGNGGGLVQCAGQAPQVLDVFELLQEGREIIPIERLNREKFFETVLERLDLALKNRRDFIGLKDPNAFIIRPNLATLAKKIESNGSFNTWATTSATRIWDEAIEDELPPGCVFEQAAITRNGVPHRIPGTSDLLSAGMKHVLELHEALHSIVEYLGYYHFEATTWPVRRLVQALLLKDTNRKELRLALYSFMNPEANVVWRHGDVSQEKESTTAWGYGAYILDLRGRSVAEKTRLQSGCAPWIGIARVDANTAFFYRIAQPGVTSRIEGFMMPDGEWKSRNALLTGERAGQTYTRKTLLSENQSRIDFILERMVPAPSAQEGLHLLHILARSYRYETPNGPSCHYSDPIDFPEPPGGAIINGSRTETLKQVLELYSDPSVSFKDPSESLLLLKSP